MVLSLIANSKDVIEEKYNALCKRFWIVAGASAAVAVMPIPGLSIAADVGLLISEVKTYKTQLKLDQESLEDVSSTCGISMQELGNAIARVTLMSSLAGGMQKLIVDKDGPPTINRAPHPRWLMAVDICPSPCAELQPNSDFPG